MGEQVVGEVHMVRAHQGAPGFPWQGWERVHMMSTVSLPLIVQAAITARGGGFLQSEVGEERECRAYDEEDFLALPHRQTLGSLPHSQGSHPERKVQ